MQEALWVWLLLPMSFSLGEPWNSTKSSKVPDALLQIHQRQPQEFQVVQPRSFCAFQWVRAILPVSNILLIACLDCYSHA